MKHILLLFTLLLASMAGMAKSNHLKFMGIPINGTISEFARKLQDKGLTIDAENKYMGPGNLLAKGTYQGQPALFVVKYDQRTKIVYCVNVEISNDSQLYLEDLSHSIEATVQTDYTCEKSPLDNFYLVYNKDHDCTGYIGIQLTTDDGLLLTICYLDAINRSKVKNEK